MLNLYKGVNLKAYHFTKNWQRNVEITYIYLEKASKKDEEVGRQGCQNLEFKVGYLVLVRLMPELF